MPSNDEDRSRTVTHWNTVVARLMTPGVVQIPGDISVAEAASLMEREQMPCLLIKDTELCFGLMTPADIVTKVVAQGLDPDDIDVRTIMTRPVQFIEYDRVLDEASTLMLTTGTPILIVTKQEQPVGVLTARDLIISPKRCLAKIPAAINIMDGGRPGAEYRALILQLSHVGALVESPIALLPDTMVTLSFSLHDLAIPLTIRGTVLSHYDQIDSACTLPHPSMSNVDIQFANLSPADQSRLKSWMLQNEPKSSDPS
jgi:CBS domain-containing protein